MATVLITGGAGGIGRELSYLFARHGYDVAIQYHTGKLRAETLAGDLSRIFGVRACAFAADFTREDSTDQLFDAVESALGAPEVLINNAGRSEQHLLTEISGPEWRQTIDINLSAAFYLCKRAARAMIAWKRGAIVNISSIWGIAGGACEAAYSAAKAGLIGLTKALARELGPSGIRVNCVAPGVIDTEMNALHSGETMDLLAAETPLGRIGKPHEVAAAVYFLASESASFITGQTLCVDGGFLEG